MPAAGVDIAMLTTHPRSAVTRYAVQDNVFMEKSFAIDPVGVRRVVQAGQEAKRRT